MVQRDTSRDVPARKDNRILRNWHGQARRIHNRVSVEAEETQHDDSHEFHKALADAGLQYSGLSWSGFAVFGDERSIAEVKRLQHLAGMVPDLQKQLAEAQRIPKFTVAEVNDAGVTVNWDEGGRRSREW